MDFKKVLDPSFVKSFEVSPLINRLKGECGADSLIYNKNKFGDVVEVICEVEPTKVHPSYSKALVAAKYILPHYHLVAREKYKILEGELILFKNGEILRLRKGDVVEIAPGEAHSGIGMDLIFEVESWPGWQFTDHFLLPEIPFVLQPDDYSCALASYTMVANYFEYGLSLDYVSEIVAWKPGYIIWPFKFWTYLIHKYGAHITTFDPINYAKWAHSGFEKLKDSLSAKEFEFYRDNTYQIDELQDTIRFLLQHTLFTHVHRKPRYEDLKRALQDGAVIEVTLNPYVLEEKSGFAVHRVVVLGIIEELNSVVIHDPDNEDPGPLWAVPLNLFKKAWLEGLDEPELTVYI